MSKNRTNFQEITFHTKKPTLDKESLLQTQLHNQRITFKTPQSEVPNENVKNNYSFYIQASEWIHTYTWKEIEANHSKKFKFTTEA